MRSSTRRHWRWLALVAAFAMVLAACGDDTPDNDPDTEDETDVDVEDEPDDAADDEQEDDAEEGAAAEGGTVLFGDEQEPTILNSFLIDGNSLVTTKVSSNVWPGAYRIQPDFSFEPYVLDGEAEITEDPFTVTYFIQEDANWSDGTPISVDDFIFTLEVFDEDAPHADQITSREGYDLIEDYETDGEKSITFNFSEPYAPWQLLFSEILPAHVLEGEDFETVLNEELPDVSGGPFMFDSWDQGTQLRLVRNEEFWGGDVSLDEVVMRYVPDTTTLTQQMVGDEIDMYDPQPQIELLDQLDGVSDRVDYEVGLGPVWEHIDFNTLVDGLDQAFVRQAIALGINRQQIVETLIQPVDPEAEVLQQPFWMANSEYYQPTFDQWDYDPDAAVALLEDNGCTRDGDGGTFTCDGVELSFRIGTTGGNERRELAQQLIQADLSEIGIEITIDNDEGAAFFDRLNTPENCDGICDYDIAMFAWVGSPNPSTTSNIYGCDDGTLRPQNWTAYCDEDLTQLMDQANGTVDPDENADLWNQAAEVIAEGVPIVPLFQQPQLLAWENSITGPQLNATNQTQFWNSHEWARTE